MRTGNPSCDNLRTNKHVFTLVQVGEAHILNHTNWLAHTDLFNPANTNLYSMLNTTNSAGNAVELYFVNTLDNGDTAGLRLYEGIVIATRGNGVTVAHEVLHDCGTADIYTVDNQDAEIPNPVPGPVSLDRIPSDWGGGYYPPDLTQRELVGRLIMRSGGIDGADTASRLDLPIGAVFGWKHINPADGLSPKTFGQAGVGQNVIQRNPGSY